MVGRFGPEYTKIHTAFKRDERNVIIPGDWTLPEFAYLADLPWRWTEKVDGTNIRLFWNGSVVTMAGRTDESQVPARLIANIGPLTDPSLWRGIFPDADDVSVYGEGYGAQIQKGGMYRQDQTVIVFDVRVGDWWLQGADIADVAAKLGLDVVPLASSSWTLNEAWHKITEGSEDKPALKSAWPEARIEGLVGRPGADLFTRKGERIITKLKVKDWRDYLRRGPGSGASQ